MSRDPPLVDAPGPFARLAPSQRGAGGGGWEQAARAEGGGRLEGG